MYINAKNLALILVNNSIYDSYAFINGGVIDIQNIKSV